MAQGKRSYPTCSDGLVV